MTDTLPHISIFSNMKKNQVELIAPLFENFTGTKGLVVFEQGTPALFLYILLKGEAEIQYKPYDSPPMTLTRLGPGDVFGWSAVVKSLFYSSSTICSSDIEAIRIRGDKLWKLVEKQPETGKLIIDRLVDSVAPRWAHAREQIQSILNNSNLDK